MVLSESTTAPIWERPADSFHAHFDCFSGAAGDMMLSACLDAAEDSEELLHYIQYCIEEGMPTLKGEFNIKQTQVWRSKGSIACNYVTVTSKYDHQAAAVPMKAHDHSHSHNDSTDHDHAHAPEGTGHTHSHSHVPVHSHGEENEHENMQMHTGVINHSHSSDGHSHGNEHVHEHSHLTSGHSHTHNHSHDHSHHSVGHSHSHEHSHGHSHTHKHNHDHDHSHDSVGHSHTHDHIHDHSHASLGHSHTHDHDHSHDSVGHSHAHKHSHSQHSSGHSHTHHHSHDHSHHSADHSHVQDHSALHGPLRNLPEIQELLEQAPTTYIPEWVKTNAILAFTALAEAEALTHGAASIDAVHFHEVGAIDSIVDTVGTLLALYCLGVSTISCSRLPLGEGTVWTAHGLLPVPAPATLRLLVGMPTCPGPSGTTGELVTPTAAALLKVLTASCQSRIPGRAPSFTILHIGIGAGTKDFHQHPNVIRVLIGDEIVGEDRTVDQSTTVTE